MKGHPVLVLGRAAVFLVGCSLLAGGCGTVAQQKPPVILRVMTYNIHHGEGLDGKVDLLRIAQLIKEQGADLVGLQEVDKGVERTQRRDFPAELAALTGMTCVFNNNYHFQGGEYGNAVLTKFPVKHWANRHYQMLRPGEQRGILQVVLDVHGRELVFLNTHIDFRSDDSERWANTGEIEALAQEYRGKPMIIVGDFNDTPESRVCRRIAATFNDTWTLIGQGEGWTIPAAAPRQRIDYLWITRGKSLVPLKAWVPQTDASDHLPVVAEFVLGD